MSATADLLDVNVWLAFSVEGHPHHASAVNSWGSIQKPALCRVTHLGFLRLLCNRQVMGSLVFDPAGAWAISERLLGDGFIHYQEEPAGLETHLKSLANGAKATRDFWTDAYLAAFAVTAGMRLVTFDSGFMRFKDLQCLVLH